MGGVWFPAVGRLARGREAEPKQPRSPQRCPGCGRVDHHRSHPAVPHEPVARLLLITRAVPPWAGRGLQRLSPLRPAGAACSMRAQNAQERTKVSKIPGHTGTQAVSSCWPADSTAVNGVTPVTASDGRHADAALVRRFRQAQTRRNRTAVFADVVRRHGDAVLGRSTERLWPDADAAVAAACDVLIAARLVMADPAKLARPDQLRGWLLAISDDLPSGLPASTDDINWEAVNARAAAGVPGTRDSPARRASLRRWLEQIVATLPGPRQRLFDLFVARGLGSRDAALELGSSVAEVRRLRRENRQAVLRAFEVTALAAAEAALDPPGSHAPGCGELRQILADAQRDSDWQEGGRRHTAVLPAALRVTVTRHLSQCGTCQGRRDDCTGRWGPELLPMLAGTELNEQVMEGLRAVPELARPRDALAARRRVASVGTAGMAVARKSAAAGAGLLAALLLLAFVWPGFLHSTGAFVPRDSTTPSSPDPGSGGLSSTGAQPVTGTPDGVSGRTGGRPVDPGGAALVNRLPPQAPGSLAAPSSASPAPPVQHTLQPSTSTPAAQPASEPPPTSSPSALSPSPSATQPTGVPATPPASPASTPPPATAPPSSSPSPSPTSPASSTPPPATTPPSTASSSAPASSIAPSPTLTSSTPSSSTTPSTTTSPTPAPSTPSTPAPGTS